MAKKNTGRKQVIMDIAKTLFSQKGYDAASVDEIAAQAGVPKSLIYYHFKSKEELLNAITNQFIAEYERLIELNIDGHIGIDGYYNFLYENREFLKIIIMESLKSGKGSMLIFETARKVLKHESKDSENELIDYYKTHGRLVAEFFTSIVPFAMFACYADDWCEYFKTDLETVKGDFVIAYRQTHGKFHQSLKGSD